jgi:hypothetical protein
MTKTKIEDVELEIKYLLKLCESQVPSRVYDFDSTFQSGVRDTLKEILKYIETKEPIDVAELMLEHENF